MIDASFVEVPLQCNPHEDNNKIKIEKLPDDLSDAKRRKKDIDVRLTKHNGKKHLGYKNHVSRKPKPNFCTFSQLQAQMFMTAR